MYIDACSSESVYIHFPRWPPQGHNRRAPYAGGPNKKNVTWGLSLPVSLYYSIGKQHLRLSTRAPAGDNKQIEGAKRLRKKRISVVADEFFSLALCNSVISVACVRGLTDNLATAWGKPRNRSKFFEASSSARRPCQQYPPSARPVPASVPTSVPASVPA